MGAKSKPIIGGHVSAAGGLVNAVTNAQAIGADAIQIFGASPQSWRAKHPSADDVARYRDVYAKSGLRGCYLHAAYLVNLASANPDFYMNSVQSLVDHLKIAAAIGADGLIFHLGSSKGIDRDAAIEQEIEGIKKVLKAVPGTAKLLLENSAGGGDKIGATIEDVARLFNGAASDRVEVCFDTAHAFEAGIITEYTPANITKLFDAWDTAIGMENLTVIHANDSMTESSSHHDKHENIGEGFMGITAFKNLANEKRLHDKVWLLEVPGFDDEGPDAKNIGILRSCF
ncbi:MAG: deoxyribonuclease IV [bacterium]|nr:deoxyribonuclease IV [bacterium]